MKRILENSFNNLILQAISKTQVLEELYKVST